MNQRTMPIAALPATTHSAGATAAPSAVGWRSVLCLLLGLGLSGCTGLVSTPEHVEPELVAKTDWSTELADEHQIDLHWWEAFDDPRLNALMAQAIQANPNLQVLAANTGVAQAQIGQARARLLPVLNMGTRTDTTSISGSTDLGTSTKYGTGSDLSWELDVWGKARKGVAANKAAYAATEAEWRAGYLVMAGAVANAYFQVRQTDAQLQRQREALGRAEVVLDINERMHDRGLIPVTEVERQRAEIDLLTAQLQDLNRVRAQSENGLATLVGRAAGDFEVPPTEADRELELVSVPAGLPSEILARRPDIVAARYRLMQAVDLEGQASLARLPTVGLTGIGGSAGMGLSNILKTWTAGLSSVVQFPVFNPNVRAQLRVSQAEVEVAEARYRVAVMSSYEEVENLLVAIESRRRQQLELESRMSRLQGIQEQFNARLEMGLISQLDMLEQQRTLLDAEQAVLSNRWQLLNDTVALFKAVGGGWDREQFASR